MKRILIAMLALGMVASSGMAQEQNREREREVRERVRELRRELRELERELGENRLRIAEPLVLGLGNRARLGVVVNTDRDEETENIGAVIQAVTPDGPADEAGLRAGDIIVSFNGEPLAETRRWQTPGDKLIELARELEDGDTVEIEYERDGERHTTTVTARRVPGYAYSFSIPEIARGEIVIDTLRARAFAGEMVDRARMLADRLRIYTDLDDGAYAITLFGARWADMELVSVDEDLGRYFGVSEGLLVVRAPRDDLLNLRSGDVILRIGGRTPNSPSHAMRILRSYEPGDELRLDIMRDRQRQTLTATVPERDRGFHWDGEF